MSKKINTAIKQATSRLKRIKNGIGTSYLPYLLTPNVLLGFGDFRVLSDARIEFPTPEDKKAVKQLQGLLDGDIYMQVKEGKLRFDNSPYLSIDFYNLRALKELYRNKLLPIPKFGNAENPQEYIKNLQYFVPKQKQRKAHKNNFSNLHTHLLLGLLLGYPEAAVASMPVFWEYPYSEIEYKKKVKSARIIHAMKYFEISAGTVVYSFPYYLENHPSIINHQKEWSDYLGKFYKTDWHQTLVTDKDFTKTFTNQKNKRAAYEKVTA